MNQYVGRLCSACYRELREIVELLCAEREFCRVMLLGTSVFPGGDDCGLLFVKNYIGQQAMLCILTEI